MSIEDNKVYNPLEDPFNAKLTTKQRQWANGVVSGINKGKLDLTKVTSDVYDCKNKNSKYQVTHSNSKNQDIINTIKAKLKVYEQITKEDIESRLTELVLCSRTKASDISSLANVLGKYKAWTRPENTTNNLNLYQINDSDI